MRLRGRNKKEEKGRKKGLTGEEKEDIIYQVVSERQCQKRGRKKGVDKAEAMW